MTANLEQTVLRNVITNETYMRKVLPFIKPKYFQGHHYTLFKQLCKYVGKYNRLPTREAFEIEIEDSGVIRSEDDYAEILSIVPKIFEKHPIDESWLMEKTEEWCQERALYIAILDSMNIIDGKDEKHTKNMIPQLLTEALGVGFDTNIGHDYFADAEDRYEYYHEDLERLPFDLELFNKITGGGLVNKSLTIALAGTGVGKSLFMCHCAAAAISMGYDVLYITMEMAEEKIAERIDANLLDIDIANMRNVSKTIFTDKLSDIKKKSNGNLVIKEYPTSQANASHFRALLNELKLKKHFKPRIIFIDYLNICASSRLKAMGGSVNSYTYIKAIAEELRGLAVEFDVPIVSATQTTRSGYGSSDPGLEDTSESFGLPATADLMFALVSSEELEKDGQLMVKQLKNRYSDPNRYKRFIVGIDRSKMRLFDAEVTGTELIDDTPPEMEARKTLGLKDLGDEVSF
jgi:replicative DNA helicase